MLVSRCALLLRQGFIVGKGRQICTTSARNSGHQWYYRCQGDLPPDNIRYTAIAVGAFMWWWILWHLWHEPEHIYGEFPYPDTSAWTDEELGIPPDDYEEE